MKRMFPSLLGVLFVLAQHVPVAYSAVEAVVYSFHNNPNDGQLPEARLLERGGTLYGTTFYGGSIQYFGTVFSVDPTTGVEKVLHAFSGSPDGATPLSSLIEFDGKLYGTTWGGGKFGIRTVFTINPTTDKEKVVYSFAGSPDGAAPAAAMVDVDGVLYGTTMGGGNFLEGTVFSINPITGQETILHSFSGDCPGGGGGDACEPTAPLIYVGGILYGTSAEGGNYDYGAAFSVDPATGVESVIYSFSGQKDGGYPYAGLVYVGGKLYGTGYEGGSSGNGVVFSIDATTRRESVLYSFGGGSDGREPRSILIGGGGDSLFGTTVAGGASGNGTVFEVNRLTGVEDVLHAFEGGRTDGQNPQAGLISVSSVLYGTTRDGGAYSRGTVFQVTP